MRKLFRWHRGSLEDSLATVVEVQDFDDIERLVIEQSSSQGIPDGFFSNVKTKYVADDSSRCGEEWKSTYYVIADCNQFKEGVVGMCNFPKE